VFVAIEGLDGSGLSTQSQLVTSMLRLQGYEAFVTKEPTNNVVGGLIRGSLTGVTSMPPDALQLLFAADRAHHLNRELLPLLKDGNIIISDRYFWTSVAYGGLYLDRGWLLDINRNFLLPDKSIFLDISPKKAIMRLKKDRFELELYEGEKKFSQIRQNYLWLFKKFKDHFVIIDAHRDRQEIAHDIVSEIQKLPKIKQLKNSKIQ